MCAFHGVFHEGVLHACIIMLGVAVCISDTMRGGEVHTSVTSRLNALKI